VGHTTREALWQCPRSAAVSRANVHSFGANTAMLTNDGNSSALRLTMCCHCLLVDRMMRITWRLLVATATNVEAIVARGVIQ